MQLQCISIASGMFAHDIAVDGGHRRPTVTLCFCHMLWLPIRKDHRLINNTPFCVRLKLT